MKKIGNTGVKLSAPVKTIFVSTKSCRQITLVSPVTFLTLLQFMSESWSIFKRNRTNKIMHSKTNLSVGYTLSPLLMYQQRYALNIRKLLRCSYTYRFFLKNNA